MTATPIGFIGTGIMGVPMAANLLAAGFPLRAWNRSAEKLEPLLARGASACGSAAEAAANADVVICMLSSGPVCDDILLGRDGALEHMRAGATLVVMSSIPVETARRQAHAAAERGVGYVDAPVSGGERGAEQASLAIMAGGTAAAFAAVQPVLEQLGRPVHVGAAGAGQLAKLANQMIVAGSIGIIAEALTLAERGGAEPAAVREALMGGFADSAILRQHGQRMLEGDFKAGGAVKHQAKDTATARAFARSQGLDLSLLAEADDLFQAALTHGDGELDHSALIREIRRRNRLAV